MKDKPFIDMLILGIVLSVFVHICWMNSVKSFLDAMLLLFTECMVLFLPVLLLWVDRKYGL